MLLSNLDLLATASGGVARLRELILTLAVQGKLVPQDPADEPAGELLTKIRAEKDRLIAEGKIKRDKPLAAIAEEEKPFALPVGWEWVRLGALTELITSGSRDWAEHYSDSGPIFVRMGNLSRGSYRLRMDHVQHVRPPKNGEGSRTSLAAEDLLLSITGDVGMLGLIPPGFGEAYINQHTCLIRWVRCTRTEFLPVQLLSGFVQQQFNSPQRGIKNSFRLTDVSGILLALPPLAEQSRIVTRVEELMRLCDALEAKGRLEAAQHAQLVSTLLGALTASATPDELADHWQRVAQHFDLLAGRPEAIDALEQTLLQLAVRGLLVPQDPQDEPASVLLQRIRAEKDRLIAAGQIKRDKPLPPITDEEKPFELPVGWAWVRFPDLCAIAGGATPSKANPTFWAGDIPWVSPKDMKVPQIRDAQDHISGMAIQGSLSLVPSGSLLMVVRGMILAHSFPIAETLVPVTINQDMKAATPYLADVLPFLLLVATGMKPEILALVERSTHGTCKLESQKIFGMLFPLPPLAEQSRIVTRVTALRRLCFELRQRLADAQATQSHLAQALVDSTSSV